MAAKKKARKKSQKKRSARRARAQPSTWEKGDTEVSSLRGVDRESLMGYRANEAELAKLGQLIKASEEFQASLSTPKFGAPTAVDWRNNNGNWISPVKNQKGCGSCVSFATIATVESRLKIVCKNPGRNDDFSESHLFFCGCGQCCGTGWNFAPALDFAKNTGLALERDWPYQPTNQPCNTSVKPVYKIAGWQRKLSIADRKQSLATVGPMVGGMKVYNDFFNYKSGVYKPTTTTAAGYHAISVIGYDDTAGCWICKNSWGNGWGDNGFFKIAYGTCMMDTNFPFYQVDLTCPTPPRPTTRCSMYVPFLVAVLRYARRNRHFAACLRYYICRTGRRPPGCQRYLNIMRRVAWILRLCPQYRRPFCRAL